MHLTNVTYTLVALLRKEGQGAANIASANLFDQNASTLPQLPKIDQQHLKIVGGVAPDHYKGLPKSDEK
eukprot:14552068-Ditylum_brightwellii.AAC.1